MSKDEYLITDPPLKALTVFAMPMILGSFFQQVYNMADSIIVGQFVGSSALAAVGACAALTNVFICVALGAGVGAGVLVSRCFGAKNYGRMKTIVSTSLISFLILSVVLGVFGFCFSHFMMSGLQTPADILEEAVLYLRVYFVGFPFLFMYNILSTMFTSIGESKIPLGLLIFSSILNIFMDLWMVAGLGLGVFGAALATLIAQGISAVFSFLIFLSRMRQYKSSFSRFDRQELYSMLRIAVPSVLQQSTVSIGMMIVQAVVNPFGTQALAGYAATMRVEKDFSPIEAGDVPMPNTAYGLSKLKAELYIQSIPGFPYVIYRPTGVYGPRELDYFLIDLPPGTSDIHLTVVQTLAMTGAIVVSTPQAVALADARKGINMFTHDKVNVTNLGIVENMAWFTTAELPENNYFIFGKEGAKKLAEEMNVPLLGQIPIVQSICEGGDNGTPVVLDGDSATGRAFLSLAASVVRQVDRRNVEMAPTQIVEMHK